MPPTASKQTYELHIAFHKEEGMIQRILNTVQRREFDIVSMHMPANEEKETPHTLTLKLSPRGAQVGISQLTRHVQQMHAVLHASNTPTPQQESI